VGAFPQNQDHENLGSRNDASSRAMWSAPSPRFVAKALFQLPGRGISADEIRALIAVPLNAERTLLAYAAANPEESNSTERVIRVDSGRIWSIANCSYGRRAHSLAPPTKSGTNHRSGSRLPQAVDGDGSGSGNGKLGSGSGDGNLGSGSGRGRRGSFGTRGGTGGSGDGRLGSLAMGSS